MPFVLSLCRFTLGYWLLVGSAAIHVPSSFDLTSSISHTILFGLITVNDLRLSPVPRGFHATPVIGSPTSRHEIYVTEQIPVYEGESKGLKKIKRKIEAEVNTGLR